MWAAGGVGRQMTGGARIGRVVGAEAMGGTIDVTLFLETLDTIEMGSNKP
jgi:hypothetical protein